jgi:LuxR family maltose regulon positive regulatory protein
VNEALLQTKLYMPPLRPNLVPRQHLIDRLNQGLHLGHKLTLISAPAGFGKTTLASEWLHHLRTDATKESQILNQIAWLSLDEGDNDPTRFLTYFIAALRTIVPGMGEGVLAALQSPQPPPTASLLTPLLNEISHIPQNSILVLDDYHLVDGGPVDNILAFFLEHLPPRMHLAMTTREDPSLPLARLRARGQLNELRVADLRFTPEEAAAFLNQVMGLELSAEEIASLEQRTEGWIAGLQLAAISMRGHQDAASFIDSFTGSHHFVMDYLVEEVLRQQPAHVQTFLLYTSILDRFCGPLCDAVLRDPSASGQKILIALERANLFIIPLDSARRWYRYHHLFADLLRQRLRQAIASSVSDNGDSVEALHIRASAWFEENGLQIEAFQHAAAANDMERAERLIEGEGMPLYYRGAAAPILHWLASLPTAELDARPSLWVICAWALWVAHQNSRVAEKLHAAEAALQGRGPDDKIQNLHGQIAALWAMLAANEYQAETIISQSRRALKYLHRDNLAVRTAVTRTLGFAYHIQGDRAAAGQAYREAIAMSAVSGNTFINILATTGLGIIQETENELYPAVESYRRVVQLVGDPPQPVACEAYFGLARIYYEWNDLDAAQEHGQLSVRLARQIESIDSFVGGEVFLARLKLAQGDAAGAAAALAETSLSVRRHNFVQKVAEVAAAQVLTLLQQGNLAGAARLAEKRDLPMSQARVHLAQGDAAAALAVLEPLRRQAEDKSWQDERLKVMVLQAVAHQAHGEQEMAAQLLGEALALAEPGGFIRTFVDEGLPMAQLLSAAVAQGIMPDYTSKLLVAFTDTTKDERRRAASFPSSSVIHPSSLVEPLSKRELEVLQLIAQGLSNREISERLFLALSTVKGHNLRIFSKLQVQRRTEAVARARELGLL